jgi:hypothetical protein
MILTTRQVVDRLKAGKTVDIYFDSPLLEDGGSIYSSSGRNLGTFLNAPIAGVGTGPEGEPAVRIYPTWIHGALTPAEVERNLNAVLTLMVDAYAKTTTGRLMMVLS